MSIREDVVETPFGRFHVETAGNGPPVLFIHGGTASAREWRPVLPALGAHARCIPVRPPATRRPGARVLPALGAHARCIAMDRLGCGLSDRSQGGYGRDHLTRSLLALADALDLDRFGVVGQSYGGFWALSLAFAAPERISRMVLVNSAGGPATEEELAVRRERMRRQPDEPEPTIEEQVERTIGWIFADPARVPAGFRDDVRWQMERADPTQWGAAGGEMERMAREAYDRIAAPTLVVWGEVDPVTSPEVGRRLAASIPGGQYVGLPGCGHTCQIECPDAFVAAVAPFLDRTA